MPDSIRAANLPPGYPAYLAYVDGNWVTAAAVAARFPGAHILTMTVTGAAGADGCDCENGDLTAARAVAWARQRLEAGAWRPVIYANASTMFAVMNYLKASGIARGRVRLLSAHYGVGAHICGPATCKYEQAPGQVIPAMDGTQWTDTYTGAGGTQIDMSWVAAGFFTPPPPPAPEEDTDMLVILRASIGGATLTFTYNGAVCRHITSDANQAAFAAQLKVIDVDEGQVIACNGGTLPAI